MARERWAMGASVLLGLQVLAMTGQADEAAVVKAIEKVGGFVDKDAKRPGKPVVGVYFSGPKITDAGRKQRQDLESLEELYRVDTNVTEAGLKELKELRNLQMLYLSNTNVADAGLKDLQGLKSLQMLALDNTKVTDAGLKNLKELR